MLTSVSSQTSQPAQVCCESWEEGRSGKGVTGEAGRGSSPGSKLKGAGRSVMGCRDGSRHMGLCEPRLGNLCPCIQGSLVQAVSLLSSAGSSPGFNSVPVHGGVPPTETISPGEGPVPRLKLQEGVGSAHKDFAPIRPLFLRRRSAGERMPCTCWSSQRTTCPTLHWTENWGAWCSHTMASAT